MIIFLLLIALIILCVGLCVFICLLDEKIGKTNTQLLKALTLQNEATAEIAILKTKVYTLEYMLEKGREN